MGPRTRLDAELAELYPGWRLRWLPAAEIRARSSGRVEHPAGLDRRTGKPVPRGLLCGRIFGPTEELICLCGKYRGEQYRGTTCEKCGVPVLGVQARCERYGHLVLPIAMPHPWDPDHRIDHLLVLPAGFREQSAPYTRDELRGLSGLYQRVVQKIDQLGRCVRHHAPTLIMEHETDQLQRSLGRLVGALRARPGPGPTLSDHLQRELHRLTPGTDPSPQLVALLAALGLGFERARGER